MSVKDRASMFETKKKVENNNQIPNKKNIIPSANKKEDNANGKIQKKEKPQNKPIAKNVELNQKNNLLNGANQNKDAEKSPCVQNNLKKEPDISKGKEIKIQKEKNVINPPKNEVNIPKKEVNVQKNVINAPKNDINIPKKEEIKNKNVQNEKKGNQNQNQSKSMNGINKIENSEASKIGQLVNGKHPVYGSEKVGEVQSIKNKEHKLFFYKYPTNIEYSSEEESISILFVGQSGSGKSTFINAYVNHILGITCNDNIRYKLIFGDAKKEKDQTQSQTDFITIYNVRSLRYNNKLFKLIDTPGAGDTRNENEKQISDVEKDKKEKEFLVMYNKLFSEEIGQLNSIVFVVKASENRENEFQKKIVKSITNLFADDIGQNCLSILTFVDNDEIVPDAVQLMEKMDIFKQKTKKKEEWYFSVSSTSYFIPFKLGCPKEAFTFTELSLIQFTKKLLSLKVYLTKETQKNLELKERQEKIIKILKENIFSNFLFSFVNFLLSNFISSFSFSNILNSLSNIKILLSFLFK